MRASLLTLLLFAVAVLRGEDGYRLWLRYEPISNPALRHSAAEALGTVVCPASSPTLQAARDELQLALPSLLDASPAFADMAGNASSALLVGTPESLPELQELNLGDALKPLGNEGFLLRDTKVAGRRRIVVAANSDVGALYGVFALLRHLQTNEPLDGLNLLSAPKIQRRLLNHWDNLNRWVERGYAGLSLWDWFNLPDYVSPRIRDYARANASIGINGAVLTNVNANAQVLTPPFLDKVAALAGTLRPYGIRVYLTARFSAPVELGGLKTADPLDPSVRAWWKDKVAEIYRAIPDFGGFLVKANSEGQPGPQAYGRNHADGANLLADALAPHGGIVMWRAFVYDQNVPDDRAKQAYTEFKPLDGQFRDNVVVQIKNGPIDFMPREPFHPLFGAMPKTPLGLELQITQEYLGASIHLVYLGTLFKEALAADTHAEGPGSTVARVVDGSLDRHALSVIAGVANTGNERNWTGHPIAAANWYAFGRLAWDHEATPDAIADEWIRMTFSNDPTLLSTLKPVLLESREAAVDYSMPLGLHHLMARDHHYGPGPWVDGGRADWTAPYYHRADAAGIGFDRSSTGSKALDQYAPPVRDEWENLPTCPEALLLWFHHVSWDYRMKSGRTLWDELCLRYQHGVDSVRSFQKAWDTLEPKVDPARFLHVQALLRHQERDAREWRDSCILYFQTFSKRPIPTGVEPAEHSLDFYEAVKRPDVPGTGQ
ncbi:alpha-glucuronidase [Opitutaceae bacterium EW11]|nr:alpha-glucuronidase [Opitutaceae bacterium EW11]